VLELDTVTLHAALVGVRLVIHAAHRLENGRACLLALGGGQHILCKIRTLAGPEMILLDTSALQLHGIDVGDAVLAASGYKDPGDRAALAFIASFDPSTLECALVAVVFAVGTTDKPLGPTVAVTPRIDGGLGSFLAGSVVGYLGAGALCPALVEVGVAVVSADNGALLGAIAGCDGFLASSVMRNTSSGARGPASVGVGVPIGAAHNGAL
jgi:hypothetical protein